MGTLMLIIMLKCKYGIEFGLLNKWKSITKLHRKITNIELLPNIHRGPILWAIQPIHHHHTHSHFEIDNNFVDYFNMFRVQKWLHKYWMCISIRSLCQILHRNAEEDDGGNMITTIYHLLSTVFDYAKYYFHNAIELN